ncbi:hypothetical protein EMM73_02135 [Rheinheimera sediminis]|uniref:hypothetical protein n=1 Tax=Rheinheimera sp. YQF-1 TaxID=2499626 RepID=UPI000FDA9384|nr:hypothetical protein [Rheinheimera sp. YQF-1]RVT48770.1 hypothetical protein EMM73_02135 [Rheinheimera sp. YQF-1]
MSFIVDVISVVGSSASISGVTLKDLLKGNPNKKEIESYIKYLEPKQVLTAPFHQEVLPAVIKSLEEIKVKTETLRINCNDEYISIVVLHLVLLLSEELMNLHKLQGSTASDNKAMFKHLQRVRVKFAKAIGLLCTAYEIDISGSPLANFVIDLGYKPRA